jgi:small subunit ribosomal protein S8
MINNPIADLLTRIRNAVLAKHKMLVLPSSKVKKSIVQILHEKGYIKSYIFNDKAGPQGSININLKYNPSTKKNAIEMLKLKKYFVKAHELPHVLNGLGIAIVSTSQGIMSDKEARKKQIGGQVWCHIY